MHEDRSILMNWFQCEQKASDFESRQQLRAEEIVAVKEAIEIISSDKVKGTLTSTLQTPTSFRAMELSKCARNC